MKTNKLSIVALTGLSAIMLFSCKKEEVNTPTSSSEATKATISGTAYAELDETKEGLEFAPNGTKVTLTYKGTDLKSYNYTGTIGTDGKYSVSIPVGRDSKEYDIVFENFSAIQTIADKTTKLRNYTVAIGTISSVTLTATQNMLLDVQYNTNTDLNPNSFQKKVTIKGTLKYISDLTTSPITKSNVPNGTRVFIGNYVTTVTNGEYQFEITKDLSSQQNFTIQFEDFKANQKTSTGDVLKSFNLSNHTVTPSATGNIYIQTTSNEYTAY